MAVLVDQLREQRLVEPRRVEAPDRLGVALAPVVDHARVGAGRPRDAALEEAEVQRREAPRDAAEPERLEQRLAALGEAAELVVLVARHRAPRAPADRSRVGRRRDAELHALRPERVVVVGRVDAEAVLVPHPTARARGARARRAAPGRSTSPAITTALRPHCTASSSVSIASCGVFIVTRPTGVSRSESPRYIST